MRPSAPVESLMPTGKSQVRLAGIEGFYSTYQCCIENDDEDAQPDFIGFISRWKGGGQDGKEFGNQGWFARDETWSSAEEE